MKLKSLLSCGGIACLATLVSQTATAQDGLKHDRWRGAYIGLFLGQSEGNTRTTTNKTSIAPSDSALVNGGLCFNNGGNIPQGQYTTPNNCANGVNDATGLIPKSLSQLASEGLVIPMGLNQDSNSASQALLGLKGGYNWESDKTVYGFEIDYRTMSGAGVQRTSSYAKSIVSEVIGMSTQAESQASVSWLTTLRGRLGYEVSDKMLPYVTGGLAWGRVSTQGSVKYLTDTGAGSTTLNYGSKSTQSGWTLGAGVDYRLSNDLLFNVSYLYVDLGRHEAKSHYTPAGAYSPTGTVTTKLDASMHMVTVGITKQF